MNSAAQDMRISHLEHFLIIGDDIKATTAWYVDVLCFHVGDSPDFGVPVNWPYLDGGDVIHMAQAPEGAASKAKSNPASRDDVVLGGRPIYHVAFRASGLTETLVHLAAQKV